MIAAIARHGDDPIAKFIRWLEDARRARIPNYEAMALATGRGGKSSVRFVLLKEVDQRGFMFFTDARSRKGGELRGNPHGSLALYWQPKGRQVRVEGRVEEITPAEADAYWATRRRQSQLAATASHQSARLRSRAELSRGSRGSLGSLGAAKFRARRSGPGFVCVLMRSNSGPTANIAYTTVRSIFDTVAGGDVICSSLRRPHTTGAFPLLLWAATHCSFSRQAAVLLRYGRPWQTSISFSGGKRIGNQPFSPLNQRDREVESISLRHRVLLRLQFRDSDRNTPSSYPATIQSVSFSDLSENHTKSARVRDIFDSARRFSDFSIRFRWASTGRRPASFLWSAGLIGRPVAQASRRLPHEALLLAHSTRFL